MRPHRFAAFVLALALGISTQPAAATPWTPGPEALGEHTLDGYIDVPVARSTIVGGSTGVVSGWVVDRTAEGWPGIDQVHLLAIAPDGGGYDLGMGIVQQQRPDVAEALGNPYFAAAGFVFPQVQWNVPAGPYTLYVRAHTPDKGWWLRSTTITISERPTPTPRPTATPTPRPLPTLIPRDPSWSSRCTLAAIQFLSPVRPYISGDTAGRAIESAISLCNTAADRNGERGVLCFEAVVNRWILFVLTNPDIIPPPSLFLRQVESCLG